MPDAAAFDMLTAAEAMAGAGIEEPHAKAIASTMRDGRAGLATRSDVRRLEDEIEGCATKAEVARIETKLDARVSAARWVLGLLVALQVMMAARRFGVLRSRALAPIAAGSAGR